MKLETIENNRGQAQSAFDFDELLARCMGKMDFLERLVESFHHQLGTDCERLEQRVRDGDVSGTASLAHRIKGAAANIAAHELKRHAQDIEKLARAERLEEIPAQLRLLRREWVRFEEAASLCTASS